MPRWTFSAFSNAATRSSLDVAGRAVADGNDDLARKLQLEVVVEGQHFVHARQVNVQFLRHYFRRFPRDVAQHVLDLVQGHDQRPALAGPFFRGASDFFFRFLVHRFSLFALHGRVVQIIMSIMGKKSVKRIKLARFCL